MEQTPEHSTLSRRQPGGWALLYERWPDLASRDLILRNHLGAAERADHDRCPPRARRHQLLDRIAIKDAVRHHLWDTGAGPLFPAEVAVHDLDGRPRISGVHGRTLPDYVISVAHCADLITIISIQFVSRLGRALAHAQGHANSQQ